MDSSPESRFEQHVGSLFDKNFTAIGFRSDEDRLAAIELLLKFGRNHYTLMVRSYPDHLAAVEFDDDLTDEDDGSYVLPADEILPSDLLSIKQKPFEELKPYLVKQEK